MGGSDTYCAFCGALAAKPFFDENDDDPEWTYDPNIIQPDDLEWMDDVILITEDRNAALAKDRAYFTGTARYDDSHWFTAEVDGDTRRLIAYADDSFNADANTGLAVPFHRACIALFCQQLGSEPDPNILYAAFKVLYAGDWEPALDIDYGIIKEYQDQYWPTKRGTEALVTNPLSIAPFELFYSLPRMASSASDTQGKAPVSAHSLHSSDCFGRLPPEILHLIMFYLDVPSVHRLRLSSRAVASVVLDGAFWKHHVRQDLPWLFDLPVLEVNSSRAAVDWACVYREMSLGGLYQHAKAIPGLFNRRRIWGISQQILDEYTTQRRLKEAATGRIGLHSDASSSPMAAIMEPKPKAKQVTPVYVSLLKRYEDFATERPIILVQWASDGTLVGLQVQLNDGSILPNRPFDCPGMDFTVEKVAIPLDDWLMGCVVTIRELKAPSTQGGPKREAIGLKFMFAHQDPVQLGDPNGDQRLFHASEGKFIIGFEAECIFPGTVARLALLEQPVAKLPTGCTSRLETPQSYIYYDQEIQRHLWRQELPLPTLKMPQCLNGYWSSIDLDMAAMETLMFGTSEEELSKIVSLSADIQFGGFEVHFSDGSQRGIGPSRHAMRTLAIDGKGGERIAAVFWNVTHIPKGFRCVTNHGRQLVLGEPGEDGRERRFPPENNTTKTLAGCVGFWPKRYAPRTNLETIGVLYATSPTLGVETLETEAPALHPQQTPSSFWDSEPPPSHLVEYGKIWGFRGGSGGQQMDNPSPSGNLYWMDCCRPLKSLAVTMCHGTKFPQLQLVALAFQHSDGGGDQTVGPDTFSPPQDTMGVNGHGWCWCTLGTNRPEELEAMDHYTHHRWDIGGSRLRSVRLWVDEQPLTRTLLGYLTSLSGIQFVATNGKESPVWGYCSGEHTAEIEFASPGEAGERAQGLKFFVSDNGRAVTRDDMIVKAIQALAARAPEPAGDS